METRRRRRLRPGDGVRPSGEETTPLHPSSGGGFNGGSTAASGAPAAAAAVVPTAPPSSTLKSRFPGTSQSAGNAHFRLHHQQTLSLEVGHQTGVGRARSSIMEHQELRTADSDAASASAAAGSDGILPGSGGENWHMMSQPQHQEETVEFHHADETQPPLPPQPLWPGPNTSTMVGPSNHDEGPIYTDSGLQLTHRLSPLRGTGTSKNSARGISIGRGGVQTPGRMEFLPREHQGHDQRQKRLLVYVRLGVVALCAVLAIGTKVAVRTALHEHRLMAAATAARELQSTTKMGKVMQPPSLSGAATKQTIRRKKRQYAEEVVRTLRLEFDAWSKRHNRDYGSTEETDRRFGIWLDNHHE